MLPRGLVILVASNVAGNVADINGKVVKGATVECWEVDGA
jgi:protocatechuate 3,4-dioxygenase beta subunit